METITIRIDKETKTKAEEMAKNQDRSLTKFIINLIKKESQKNDKN